MKFNLKLLSLLLTFLFLNFLCEAQNLLISEVSKTSIYNGKKLKKLDSISINEIIEVKKEGYIYLVNPTGWSFELKEGTYRLDSCYAYYKTTYKSFDSVVAIMNQVLPKGKKCEYNGPCGTDYYGDPQELEYDFGNIAFIGTKNKKIYTTCSSETDTVTVRWKDPIKENKIYFINIQNLFGDNIDYILATTQKQVLHLNNYRLGNNIDILLTITSGDCRKSCTIMISCK